MDFGVPAFLLNNISYIGNRLEYFQRRCRRKRFKYRNFCKYQSSFIIDSTHSALQGVHSHWITDEILATSSLCYQLISQNRIINQFESLGITSLINLQELGEYSTCGCNVGSSGFTYEPSVFMENKIYYFNYQWKEWEELQVKLILDMVKVVCFTIKEGKVAIHCSDGLGRTSALIACYLVFSQNFTAQNAITFVRMKKPKALEEKSYIICVEEFEKFIKNHNYVFQQRSEPNDEYVEFSLNQQLYSQQLLLYGDEARHLRHVPKILFIICETIIEKFNSAEKLSSCQERSLASSIPNFLSFLNHNNIYHQTILKRLWHKENPKLSSENGSNSKETPKTVINEKKDSSKCDSTKHNIQSCKKDLESSFIVEGLLADCTTLEDHTRLKIQEYMINLYYISKTWYRIKNENELKVLTGLLYEWLETLQSPVITKDGLTTIVINGHKPERCLKQFDQVTQFTLEYLFRFLDRIKGITLDEKTQIMMRFIAALTQRNVRLKSSLVTPGRNFQILQKGTIGKILEFVVGLLAITKEREILYE